VLFNSFIFIFIFLPCVLIAYHLSARKGLYRLAVFWLILASLFFYGWWNPKYLLLISSSILVNYFLGISIQKNKNRFILVLGIIFNLGLIAYFKYANFFVDTVNSILSTHMVLNEILLPLAISFFTFQQIAYLVDAYRGKTEEYDFLHYSLFVTFFPQLIAGPIVHHKEMMPQFSEGRLSSISTNNLAIGSAIFLLGLIKKVVFADTLALYANPVFEAGERGLEILFFEAWIGSLAYTFQLYFDFSGYSDMALGLARLFGITLPINFFSPYKQTNISDFWRHWHITLSRLIRNYLWDPVSLFMTRLSVKYKFGNQRFFLATILIPTTFTFFWVGLWHGAGWNFILFGLIHGFYLVLFNLWTNIKRAYPNFILIKNKFVTTFLARLITFFSVSLAWVLFRSESLEGALRIYSSMFGLFRFFENPNPSKELVNQDPTLAMISSSNIILNPDTAFILIILLGLLVWFTPNVAEWFREQKPALGLEELNSNNNHFLLKEGEFLKNKIRNMSKFNIALICALLILSMSSVMFFQGETEFLYFNF